MSRQELSDLLARFRRQMLAARLLRWALGAVLLGGLIACYPVDQTTRCWILAALAVLCGLWIALALRGLKALKRTRTGAALLAAGRIDEGWAVLAQVLKGFTPLHSPKILACHQLAIAAHLTRRYPEAVAICRELLTQRLGEVSSVATATRLILADCLLGLDDAQAAGPVVEALDRADLSLADRLAFLPIELHYHLVTGREAQAVRSLPEKVRLAELLDSSAAALVHALLAEGCRRMNLTCQRDFLLRRAMLLADVEPILARHRPLLEGLDVESVRQAEPEPGNP